MQSELKNQTLVAAELARQCGFENTHFALLQTLKELGQIDVAATSHAETVKS